MQQTKGAWFILFALYVYVYFYFEQLISPSATAEMNWSTSKLQVLWKSRVTLPFMFMVTRSCSWLLVHVHGYSFMFTVTHSRSRFYTRSRLFLCTNTSLSEYCRSKMRLL